MVLVIGDKLIFLKSPVISTFWKITNLMANESRFFILIFYEMYGWERFPPML